MDAHHTLAMIWGFCRRFKTWKGDELQHLDFSCVLVSGWKGLDGRRQDKNKEAAGIDTAHVSASLLTAEIMANKAVHHSRWAIGSQYCQSCSRELCFTVKAKSGRGVGLVGGVWGLRQSETDRAVKRVWSDAVAWDGLLNWGRKVPSLHNPM